MNATVRSLSALLVVLALVAGLPVTCACAPAPPSPAAAGTAHHCCAPPVGVSVVNGHDCCGGTVASVDAVPAPAPALAAALVPIQPFFVDVVSAPLSAHVLRALAAPPPLPLVLRI